MRYIELLPKGPNHDANMFVTKATDELFFATTPVTVHRKVGEIPHDIQEHVALPQCMCGFDVSSGKLRVETHAEIIGVM
jgi:hypothetical protein